MKTDMGEAHKCFAPKYWNKEGWQWIGDWEFLKEYYPDLLKERYDVSLELCNYEILKEVALKRGFFKADEIDYDKAAVAVLADFRNMRIGRITLDKWQTNMTKNFIKKAIK